uniref:Ribonuclease E n=1 Tax=Mastocarpus papillatus TaxID=31436 RepID=A0A342RZA5_9FLOR|nr:ribonuclease E [Mastocarpus papillatus]AOL58051.1 ribonuclease E [Mastocarpus papillatus]
MVKKIIISRFNNIAAVLQNNKIQEIILVNKSYQVNDIYIGIVQRIFSSINAAFIKLSKNGKSGFIHASDIKPLKKNRYINNINEILSINQIILVQIIKEPTINKGPRLTANIHLSSKYIVLIPFCNKIYISNKIYDKNERTYLESLAVLLKPANMGILIRSSSQGISENAISEDLRRLKKQWSFIQKIAISSRFPSLIYKEEDLIKKIMKDFYEENTRKIIVDSEKSLKNIKYYLHKWQCITPITNIRLQLYNKSQSILEQFNIKNTILEALKPKVKLSSGGHIVIDNSEALTIIDVNSGSFNQSNNSKETILRTNFYAAIEIAYQLKIRNINGVIIIDFIDMQSQQDQLQLLEHFSNLLKLDNAKPQIVQLSELGLVELTRRRRGQSLKEIFNSKNHSYLTLQNKYNSNNLYTQEKSNLFIHRNIKSLFFNKKFKNTVFIKNKLFLNKNKNKRYQDYLYLDKLNTINLINPRKSYIIPLTLYYRIIKIM